MPGGLSDGIAIYPFHLKGTQEAFNSILLGAIEVEVLYNSISLVVKQIFVENGEEIELIDWLLVQNSLISYNFPLEGGAMKLPRLRKDG